MKIKTLATHATSKALILCLLLLTCLGYLPSSVKAASSFESVKDTISNSDISQANVTHTVVASTTQPIGASGYFEIVFPSGFTNVLVGGVTCPNIGGAGVASIPTTNTVRCTYATAITEATSTTFTITGVTNPSTIGSYLFSIDTKTSLDVAIEHSTFRVAIVNGVIVTASVEASLTFSILGMATSSEVVNGATLTGSSTMNAMAFGVLTPGVEKTLGQKLKVTTNATYGFTVTVQQDHNLLSSGGADIDSFNNGVEASTTPLAWGANPPTNILGQENTYGHFGFTSQDASLSNGDPFGATLYKGFNNTDPVEVMYHTGPADGLTPDIGTTTVAYSIQIGAMQEAGDYSNTLTYLGTPTY
jgi:hypothetical protein